MEEQEDELLALQSIFSSEEFVQEESKAAGEIRVSVELPSDFNVAMKEGEMLRQYEISFLPPLLLTFELPEDYPSSSPPSFTLTCSWLTHTQLSALGARLTELYQATGGAVVLFTWVQFLKEDALRFLGIHTLLRLPADEQRTQSCSQDSLHASLPEPKNSHQTPGPTDKQSWNAPDRCGPATSAPFLEVEPPIEILADSQNPSTSDWSSTDAPAVSCKAHQSKSTSNHSEVNHNDPNSRMNTDYQKTFNDSNPMSQTSDGREAEQTLQSSGFKPDYPDDLSPAEGQSKPLPFSQSDQVGQEDFFKESVSASLLLPSSSSGPMDGSEHGAASLTIDERASPQNEDQTISGLSPAPSQTLLSQILIHDAAQQQKQFDSTVFECGVCFAGYLGSDCVQLPECGHIFCQACLVQFCKLQITEGNVRGVTCPQAECTATPTPAQVKSLVGEDLFGRYDLLLLQNTLDCMPDVVYCPRLSCSSAVIRDKSSKAAVCSVCCFAFCVVCRKTFHGRDDCQGKKDIEKQTQGSLALPQSEEGMKALWDDYASGSKQRKHLLESRYGRKALLSTMEDFLSEGWIAINSKNCPDCFCRIQKDSGCNIMTCSQCGRLFCWACLTKLSSSNAGAHFWDSPCSLLRY